MAIEERFRQPRTRRDRFQEKYILLTFSDESTVSILKDNLLAMLYRNIDHYSFDGIAVDRTERFFYFQNNTGAWAWYSLRINEENWTDNIASLPLLPILTTSEPVEEDEFSYSECRTVNPEPDKD